MSRFDSRLVETRVSNGGQFAGTIRGIHKEGPDWVGNWWDETNGHYRTITFTEIDKDKKLVTFDETGAGVTKQTWLGRIIDTNADGGLDIKGDEQNGEFTFTLTLFLPE